MNNNVYFEQNKILLNLLYNIVLCLANNNITSIELHTEVKIRSQSFWNPFSFFCVVLLTPREYDADPTSFDPNIYFKKVNCTILKYVFDYINHKVEHCLMMFQRL